MIGGVVARHTLTVHRAPLVDDDRGNLIPDWDAAASHTSTGWAVDAGDTSEDTRNRDGSSVTYTCRGPWGADILGSDRVALFGDVFEVFGSVLKQPGPTPRTSHVIVRLTNWAG